jgi:hypothetical protein
MEDWQPPEFRVAGSSWKPVMSEEDKRFYEEWAERQRREFEER